MGLFKYTSKDFAALKTAMLQQVPALAPAWTNLNEGELGVALITAMAGVGDMLAFYLDRQADETFLPTALTRASIVRLAALIDYRLSRPVAAKTKLRFTIPGVLGSNVLIAKYTQAQNAAGLYFTTQEDATIYAGQTFVDVDAYQGQFFQESFTGTGLDTQVFTLANTDAAQNFLLVDIAGVRWVEDSSTVSPTATNVYEVLADDNDLASVRFISSLGGALPPNNTTITVSYVTTAGAGGNTGAATVTKLVKLGDNAVPPTGMTVTNLVVASGGEDRESIDEARINAPRQLRTLNRVVTLQDYLDLTENFPGVGKAQAVNHNGYVEMYVAPSIGGAAFVIAPSIALTNTAASGTLAAGTYKVAVTALDAFGETTASEFTPATGDPLVKSDDITVALNDKITVTVTNSTGATGYNVWISNDGGVTYKKYATNVTPGVSTTVVDITAFTGTVTPLPTSNSTGVRATSGTLSLLNALSAFLEERRLIGTTFSIFNPTYVPVAVTATVTLYPNFLQSAVQSQVNQAITTYFTFPNRNFADAVPISDLYSIIMQVDGVKQVNISAPSGDTAVTTGHIASAGTITLTMSGGVA